MQSFFDRATALAKDLQTSAEGQLRQVVQSAQGANRASERNENENSNDEEGKLKDTTPGGGSQAQEQTQTSGSGVNMRESMSSFFSRAKEVAKDVAQNAKATAEEAEGQFWDFTSKVKESNVLTGGAKKKGEAAGDDKASKEREELERHGITDELVAYVKSIKPNEFLAKSREWPKEDKDTWKLTPWQEKHVLLVLGQASELRDCRYLLTPKKMSEQRFWEIYFALSQKHLFTTSSSGNGGKEMTGVDRGSPGVDAATKDLSNLELSGEKARQSSAQAEGNDPDDGNKEEGGEDVPDDLSDDLEAYLESVLANKDISDDEDGAENGEDDDDDDDDTNLEDYINELEEDLESSMSDEIVKVEVEKIEDASKGEGE